MEKEAVSTHSLTKLQKKFMKAHLPHHIYDKISIDFVKSFVNINFDTNFIFTAPVEISYNLIG